MNKSTAEQNPSWEAKSRSVSLKKFPARYGTRSYITVLIGALQFRGSVLNFRNKLAFHNEELLAPHPALKLENHPLSAVRLLIQYTCRGRLLHPPSEVVIDPINILAIGTW